MQIEAFADAASVALAAARFIAGQARAAVLSRGQFVLAVSGGTTPWEMLRALTREDMPWHSVHFVQVDERVVPAGHADRNLTHMLAALAAAPVSRDQVYAMPVESDNLEAAATAYANQLAALGGRPPVLDLVHLGLGADGHTASLVPGDAVLAVTDRDVAITGEYQGRRRITLTYPIINRARNILWLVTGASKASMLARLRAADPTIPAGRVRQNNATILADAGAAG
jgi:6-phosphogluconolactonase